MDHYSILDSGSQAQPGIPPAQAVSLPDRILPAIAELNGDSIEKNPSQAGKRAFAEPYPADLLPPTVHFPGEDGGKSLVEMARRDLDATLQLLVERAEYITGATGAAIALRESEEMVCRASSGSSAPGVGARLQVDSGLSGESVRLRRILLCEDARTDPRVNRESCEALGLVSAVVMPLFREQEIAGLFELFSDKAHAFTERDLAALERMGEMVNTALDHAEAAGATPGALAVSAALGRETSANSAGPASQEKTAAPVSTGFSLEPGSASTTAPAPKPAPQLAKATAAGAEVGPIADSPSAPRSVSPEDKNPAPAAAPLPETGPVTVRVDEVRSFAGIHKCESCGFPISEGRRLCLDCEARITPKAPSADKKAPPGNDVSELSPQFLTGGLEDSSRDKTSIFRNKFILASLVVGTILLVAFLLSRLS
jgi:putative methionine-R-sulfoxide reductase with GAF domain